MATTFDTLKTQATKPLFAGVGVTDAVVEIVRDYVTEAQKTAQKRYADVTTSVKKLDLEPAALRTQATTVVNARVDALSKDAKARRTAIEKRVAELQSDAKAIPAKVTGTYGDLVTRGEGLVTRIRKQESTQATKAAAKTTTTKAKTTTTQAKKATKSTAKKTTTTAKKTAAKKSAPAKSSAKATATAAQRTVENATQAVADAAEKVGD